MLSLDPSLLQLACDWRVRGYERSRAVLSLDPSFVIGVSGAVRGLGLCSAWTPHSCSSHVIGGSGAVRGLGL